MAERTTIESSLAGHALTTPADVAYEGVAMMPEARVLKIGGQSILDRGRQAVFPLVEEIAALKDRYMMLIGAGGGTRARHVYSIASDLEMPTGVLAALGGYVPMQNARMLQMLLAKHGGIYVMHDDFEKLPLYFRLGCIPIMTGMPPFSYWEKPDAEGRIPPNRTDAGVFLSGEALGSRRVIYVKDEEGLYERDPKKDPGAALIRRIGARELIARDLDDLVIERVVIEYLTRSRWVKELQIINGLRAGELTRALAGEDNGTIIFQES
jgi:molybdenum storage protein